MTASGILGTLQAHRTLLPREVHDLTRAGVPASALMKPHPLRAGYIVWVSAERFEFEHHISYGKPERAFLFLVQDSEGAPLDVVAWQPQAQRLGSWLGRTWGLGEESIYQPRLTSDALPIWRTPLDWLRAHRRGCVLLQPKLAARFLDCAAPLQAEDIPHGHELRQVLTIPAPRIVIAVSCVRAA